ncbi:hypothetical protein PITCH_A1720004 [uncultured Desulfobacterium sp.]|uniref:PIN domain-containing protein n=1 Tax=uncultured Desulfobacterium sp. TaxID=201089 RepID=A0A445MUM0_9BACT|nr:hypothetical protein PITCH_A1720004 [uncultured Desulfobacterium sp.]
MYNDAPYKGFCQEERVTQIRIIEKVYDNYAKGCSTFLILIASTALNHQCTMVMANPHHFSEIKGIIVENWLEP